MIDAKRLLDQLLGDGTAADGQQQAPGSGIGGVLGQVQGYARDNPLLAGGAAGGLAALLLGSKPGREIGGNELKIGGMAVIGGLAYKAYRDWQAGQAEPTGPATATARTSVPILPPPAESPFAPAQAVQGEAQLAETLIVAMIAAAKADGHIDAEERGRIYERLEQGGLDAEEVAFLNRELQAPLDIERIVRAAANKETAVEIYAASLLAIRSDTPAEHGYLAMLAARLNLEPGLVQSIEGAVAPSEAATVD